MRAIEILRSQVRTEEFDYQRLVHILSNYSKPRDAISRLMRNQSIVRVKKGLYVFGENYLRGVICKESLANLIYGPSYISLEYALSYYGMIPERVEQMTSMTPLRNKTFQTPLGVFAYQHIPMKKYSVGLTLIEADHQHQFIIATPEKALSDRISIHKNLNNTSDLHSFICEGLRIEEESLRNLNIVLLEEIANVYHNPAVTCLVQLVKDLKWYLKLF